MEFKQYLRIKNTEGQKIIRVEVDWQGDHQIIVFYLSGGGIRVEVESLKVRISFGNSEVTAQIVRDVRFICLDHSLVLFLEDGIILRIPSGCFNDKSRFKKEWNLLMKGLVDSGVNLVQLLQKYPFYSEVQFIDALKLDYQISDTKRGYLTPNFKDLLLSRIFAGDNIIGFTRQKFFFIGLSEKQNLVGVQLWEPQMSVIMGVLEFEGGIYRGFRLSAARGTAKLEIELSFVAEKLTGTRVFANRCLGRESSRLIVHDAKRQELRIYNSKVLWDSGWNGSARHVYLTDWGKNLIDIFDYQNYFIVLLREELAATTTLRIYSKALMRACSQSKTLREKILEELVSLDNRYLHQYEREKFLGRRITQEYLLDQVESRISEKTLFRLYFRRDQGKKSDPDKLRVSGLGASENSLELVCLDMGSMLELARDELRATMQQGQFYVGEILLYRATHDPRQHTQLIDMEEFLFEGEDLQRRLFILAHYFSGIEHSRRVTSKEFLLFEQLKEFENRLDPDREFKSEKVQKIAGLSLGGRRDFLEYQDLFLEAGRALKPCLDPVHTSKLCREKKYVELLINLLSVQISEHHDTDLRQSILRESFKLGTLEQKLVALVICQTDKSLYQREIFQTVRTILTLGTPFEQILVLIVTHLRLRKTYFGRKNIIWILENISLPGTSQLVHGAALLSHKDQSSQLTPSDLLQKKLMKANNIPEKLQFLKSLIIKFTHSQSQLAKFF